MEQPPPQKMASSTSRTPEANSTAGLPSQIDCKEDIEDGSCQQISDDGSAIGRSARSLQESLTQGVDNSNEDKKNSCFSDNSKTSPLLNHYQTASLSSVLDNMQRNETVYEFGSSSTTNTAHTTTNTITSDSTSTTLVSNIAMSSSSSPNSNMINKTGSNSNMNSSISSSGSLVSSSTSNRYVISSSEAIQSPTNQTTKSITSQQPNPNFDSHVISERVKNLATQIYQELKRIISRCNYDEDVLSGLMPLIVRVLESLDLALIENQQLQVELELCKDDNEQLVTMFEKEKIAKRAIDKKLIESEYAYEEERQQHQQKIESLENIVKMFELKSKNASDQAARLEEKEAERMAEYNKLHERYSDLLKSHCDVMERVRHLLGNDATEVTQLSNLNVPSMVVSSSDLSDHHDSHQTSRAKLHSTDNLSDSRSNFNKRHVESSPLGSGRSVWNDTELTLEDASLVVIEDDMENASNSGDRGQQHEERNDQDTDQESGDKDSITYTSMERQFRKLIQENKDLLNTKNALNVVKDDLIAEVDRLSNVVSMYEQETKQLNGVKEQLRQKNSNLESDLRKVKEELAKAQQKIKENDEEGVHCSQRKRFSRVEMAKVLAERNNYKERLIELQDAVRYTEQVRQNKETEKRSGLWKFFSNLFGAQNPGNGIGGTPNMANSRNSSPVVSYYSSALNPDSQNIPTGFDPMQTSAARFNSRLAHQRLTNNSDLVLLMDADLASDRNRAMRSSRSMSDRVHAYGWSLPAGYNPAKNSAQIDGQQQSTSGGTMISGNSSTTSSITMSASSQSVTDGQMLMSGGAIGGKLHVPVPLYCRPLSGDSLGMKIWCATAIDLSGGDSSSNYGQSDEASDYGVAGSSNDNVVDQRRVSSSAALKNLEEEVDRALKKSLHRQTASPGQIGGSGQTDSSPRSQSKQASPSKLNYGDSEGLDQVSTCVWICSTQHSRSKITIIDIKNKPNDVLDSFYVQTYLYCIKSIPGAKSTDFLNLTTQTNESQHLQRSTFRSELLEESPDIYKLIKVDKEAEIQLRRRKLRSALGQQQQASADGVDNSASAESVGREHINVQKFQTPTTGVDDERDAEISRILDDNASVGVATLQKLEDYVAHTQPNDDIISSELSTGENNRNKQISPLNTAKGTMNTTQRNSGGEQESTAIIYYQPISTYLPTVWMGGKDCTLYVHSAIGQWKDCVACVKLPDSIIQICHHRGRAFIALANGQLCVFMRDSQTKQWDFSQYLIVDIGILADNQNAIEITAPATADSQISTNGNQKSKHTQDEVVDRGSKPSTPMRSGARSSVTSITYSGKKKTVASIRCLEVANGNIWIGYRNMIIIIDSVTFKMRHSFNAVPQIDNQVRQLVSMKDGVFCCLRSDLTLRLYSSLKPYQHIQDIDIEPLVTRIISPKTFVISRITALKAVDNVLWIGNALGIILTIPCDLDPQASENRSLSASDESETRDEGLSIARYVPKCEISNAQISFHGHKDAVKFFVHSHNLMLSGGEGYFDFRLNLDDQSKSTSSSDKSHLILWQLFN